uniref:Uncharacterized protein n=1 Tax=Oncorhynchus tshawytscha TaxID=74940 RepID=A0A8C8K3Q8_ONCTS
MENPYEQTQKGCILLSDYRRIYSRHDCGKKQREISKTIKKAMGKIHVWTHIMKDTNTFDNQHLE